MTAATDELAELIERTAPRLVRAMRRVARAEASGEAKEPAIDELAAALSDVMARADLAGRREIASRYSVPVRFQEEPSILEQIMDRYRAWHGPTLARDIYGQIAERIRLAFEAGRDSTLQVLQEVNDWTVAYADTVYRTNVASAYAAGSWRQSLDPEILVVVPAKRYSAVGDSDTRPNHLAADGLIAGVTDPVWDRFAPPMGFNCRCSLLDVDRFELEDRGLLNSDGSVIRVTPSAFSAAHPDPGFGTGRPDLRIYGR